MNLFWMIRPSHGLWPTAAIALLVAASAIAVAQDPTVDATVDRNPVGVAEQFTYSLVLSNTGMGGGKNLRLPDLARFHLLAGPNTSSSMQFINGAVSSSVTYSYVLQPKEAGKFTLGPATIEVDGKKLETKPIVLEVVKTATKPKQQAAPEEDVSGQIGDRLFLRATLDRTRVTQGEQVNLIYKIYSQVRLLGLQQKRAPNYTGFWSEELEVPKEETAEVVDGKRYRTQILQKMALFPTQSGTLEINPLELVVAIQVQAPRSLDPFDALFRDPFGRTANASVKSNALSVRVDPLPAGAPAEFKGAVGQFAMSTSVDKKGVKTNEPVSIRVTVSGTGNIKLLEAPAAEFPADFEQYAPKMTETINKDGERITGNKTFEFLVLPRYPGVKSIKPITFSYYDLGRKEYVRLRSPQIDLNVEQGAAGAAPLVAGNLREDVQLLSQDIRFIKISAPSFARRGDRLLANPLFLLLLLAPVVGVAGVAAFTRRRRTLLADEAGYRNRRALRVAHKGLKQAEYLLREKGGTQKSPSAIQRTRFYAEIARALWKYLSDKLGIPPADLSIDTCTVRLTARSVDPGLVHALRVLLEQCDLARFAPTSLEVAAMQKTYDEAKRLIVELERTLR